MRRCSNILYLILCYFIDCETDDESVSDYEDEISWLKSLRPRSSWKPSEEQMRYLKKVYESYDFCDGERNALESLHNDLIKLGVKEEPEYYQHFDPDC